MPLYGFLIFPKVFFGAIYNDNLYLAGNDRVAGWGLEITPNLIAVDDQGIHKTTLMLNADAMVYPGASHQSPTTGQSPSNVTGSASLDHTWKPTTDVTVDVIGGFIRQNGIFGTLGATGTSFVTSTTFVTAAGSQQYWNEATGALVVDKEFADRWFLRGGVGAQYVGYEPPPPGAVSVLESGADYNGFLRGGYRVTPQVSAFVEVDGNTWRYNNPWYNANASRVIGGLSSDLISLFRGEVFAGAQKQVSANGSFGAVEGPTYGATIFYYPTRYLTLAASVQQGFGSAAVQSVTPLLGSPSGDTVQARFQADYNLSEYWTATARAGWARTTWSNSSLIETASTFGGSLSYNYWRNFSLTVNYQYTATTANQAGPVPYTQNLVSAGITYRY